VGTGDKNSNLTDSDTDDDAVQDVVLGAVKATHKNVEISICYERLFTNKFEEIVHSGIYEYSFPA